MIRSAALVRDQYNNPILQILLEDRADFKKLTRRELWQLVEDGLEMLSEDDDSY